MIIRILFVLCLWGFSASANAASKCQIGSIIHYNRDVSGFLGVAPLIFYAPSSNCDDHLKSILSISPFGEYADCKLQTGTLRISCTAANKVFTVSASQTGTDDAAQPTQTCGLFAGDVYGSFKTASSFCADFGANTGGKTPEPLYCLTDPVATDSSGETLHYLTANTCTQPNVPEDPDPNPDPDPDPNPDPDPTPDPTPEPGTGSPGGNGSPTSGTSGSATGTIGADNVTLNQDFKPITERLDIARADAVAQTKYLAEKIDKTTSAVTLGTGELLKLNSKADATNSKLDTLNTSITNGTAEIGGKLDSVNSNLGNVKSSLDGVANSLDALNDSLNPSQDGGALGSQVALPDYDYAVTNGVAQVLSTVDQYTLESGLGQFSDPNHLPSIFTGAESLAEVFDIASSSCSPIAFGSHASLDFCDYAPSISALLEVIIWGLTAIFIFVYVSTLLARERL